MITDTDSIFIKMTKIDVATAIKFGQMLDEQIKTNLFAHLGGVLQVSYFFFLLMNAFLQKLTFCCFNFRWSTRRCSSLIFR